MTDEQKQVVRFAYLDLMGAKESADAGDFRQHDWGAHWQTIMDMEKVFPDTLSDLITFGE
jgi:hypothetical protein